MTKALLKAVIRRSRLKTVYSKSKILLTGITISIDEIFVLIYYEKQNLIISVKKFNLKDLNDNKKFWKKKQNFLF